LRLFILIQIFPIFQDFGQDISISAPRDFNSSDSLKKAFSETSAIDWTAKYCFSAIEKPIVPLIVEITTIHKRNSTLTNPGYTYYVSEEDAAGMELNE
jgi:hypothetical protein